MAAACAAPSSLLPSVGFGFEPGGRAAAANRAPPCRTQPLTRRGGKSSGGGPIEAPCQCLQVLDQLRRLVNSDLQAEHGDPHRQPAKVVVASPVLAAVGVDRLE